MKHIFDDSDKNKYEAYTKQEVLNVIQEAISSGELPEEINGLVLTFKNPVDNLGYKIAFCTQAKYNELEAAGTLEANCLYYITDDKTLDDITEVLNSIGDSIETINANISEIRDDIEDINEEVEKTTPKEITVFRDENRAGVEKEGLYQVTVSLSSTQRYTALISVDDISWLQANVSNRYKVKIDNSNYVEVLNLYNIAIGLQPSSGLTLESVKLLVEY